MSLNTRTRNARLCALLGASVGLILGACSTEPTNAPGAGLSAHGSGSLVASSRKSPVTYLPYGVPIPTDTVLTGDVRVEPYDPSIHEIAKAGDETLNLMRRPGWHRVKLPGHARELAPAPTTAAGSVPLVNDGWRSWHLTPDSTRGLLVREPLKLNQSVTDPNRIVYAPTNLPAGGSCLEVTFGHLKANSWGDAYGHWIPPHSLMIYDWCLAGPNDAGFYYVADMSSSGFQSPYARIFTNPVTQVNELAAYVYIAPGNRFLPAGSSDTWTAYLYNFSTGTWNSVYTSTGTTKIGWNYGWVMHESRGYMGDCQALHSVDVYQADAISRSDGYVKQIFGMPGWSYDYVIGACWSNANWYILTPDVFPIGNGWHARTPNDL